MTDTVLLIVLVLLSAAGFLALVRMLRGPSILDRVIASEVLLVTLMLGLLTNMIYAENTRTLTAVLVVALLGFTAPVSVARYVSTQEPPSSRRRA